jgi:flagellar basal-body rod protein FlgB
MPSSTIPSIAQVSDKASGLSGMKQGQRCGTMTDLAIFSIGHARSRWLATRAAVIANNVANVDTPGFRPSDVGSFLHEMKAVELRRSHSGHLKNPSLVGGEFGIEPRSVSPEKHSGNRVSIESEMAQLGQTRSQQALATGIVGAFHRMLMASTKG